MAVGLIHPYNASNGLSHGDSYGEYLWNHSRISSHLGLKAFKTRSRRRFARDEWVSAIDRLNQQIRDWLTDSDPDHRFLEVRELPCQLREQGIGTYEARGLLIRVGRLEVRVEPIARYVAGPHSATGVIHVSRAFGRVDLTDGLQKFMIFRVEKDPEDRWSLIEQDGFRLQPFDRSAFEEAFKALLQ